MSETTAPLTTAADPEQVRARLRLAFTTAIPALPGDPSRPDADTLQAIVDADGLIRRLAGDIAELRARLDAAWALAGRWGSEALVSDRMEWGEHGERTCTHWAYVTRVRELEAEVRRLRSITEALAEMCDTSEAPRLPTVTVGEIRTLLAGGEL